MTATDIAIDVEFDTGVWMVQSICVTLKSTSALTKTHERFVRRTPYTTRGQLCQEKLLTTNVFPTTMGRGVANSVPFISFLELGHFVCFLVLMNFHPLKGVGSLLGRK